jgi:preprotein translocase YajC subunit
LARAVITDGPAGKRKVNRKDAPMQGSYHVLAATASKSSFNPSTLIIILVAVVAFYMLIMRPRQRRQQQAQQKQNTMQPGARVRTTAGMYATVVDVDGDDVILEVAPGVEVRYMKRAVMDVVSEPDVADEDVAPDDETEDGSFDADSYDEAETDAAAPESPTAEAVVADPIDDPIDDETAYEQATGTKKD